MVFGKADKPARPEGQSESIRGFTQPETTPQAPPASTGVAPEPARGTGEASVIRADLRVIGNLESAGDIQVDGSVEGDIASRALTVGEGAHIQGSIAAETARVHGAVSGQIKATSVKIAKTAKLMGDITYQTLAIEEGAFVEGHCRRMEAEKGRSEARVSPLKPAQQQSGGDAKQETAGPGSAESASGTGAASSGSGSGGSGGGGSSSGGTSGSGGSGSGSTKPATR